MSAAYDPTHMFSCPALVAIPIVLVRPGHEVWGWENNGNYSRKGWALESEPIVVDQRGLQDRSTAWVINNRILLKDSCDYVLVPDNGI